MTRGRVISIWTAVGIGLALVGRMTPILAAVDVELALVFVVFATVCAASLAVSEARRPERLTPLAAWVAASLSAWPALVIPAALVAFLPPRCNDTSGWAVFALLPLVTTFVASALGLAAGTALKGRWAHAIAPLLLAASVVYGLLHFADTGIMAVYSPLFGYFPGPIYDDVAWVSVALISYRFLCLAYAALLVAAIDLVRNRARSVLAARAPPAARRDRRRGAGGDRDRERLGDRPGLSPEPRGDPADLDGTFESEHFVYHYPRGSWIEREIATIAEDHEFRYDENEQFLGIGYDGRIESFLYRSSSQKKRLTGAGRTIYADIANGAIHVNARGFPNAMLGHELLHVMTRPFSAPVLHLSWKIALLEGIATASEGYRGDLTIHQWARAMRDLGKAPRLASIMGPVGFWRQQSSRSYLIAGSFVLFLHDTYGAEKLREVYAWGDFDAVYHKSLTELAAEWRSVLDETEVSDAERTIAAHRFARGAIFDRPCARCVARLREKGDDALRAGRAHVAVRRYARALRASRRTCASDGT